MTHVRHSSQSSCLSKKYILPGDVNLKIQAIDILLFQYFVCFYVWQDAINFVLKNSIYENKQTNKTKAVREFQVKDPIPFGKIV